jgi:hypothetical protein
MLIKFEIQMDDNGGVNVVQAQANPNPNLQGPQQLGVVYPGPVAANPKKGGAGPIDGLGTGAPSATPLSSGSGSGMVFVLGPIVICGSGPGHTGPGNTGPGGDGPIDGLATGKPDAEVKAAAQNYKAAVAKYVKPPRRQAKRK